MCPPRSPGLMSFQYETSRGSQHYTCFVLLPQRRLLTKLPTAASSWPSITPLCNITLFHHIPQEADNNTRIESTTHVKMPSGVPAEHIPPTPLTEIWIDGVPAERIEIGKSPNSAWHWNPRQTDLLKAHMRGSRYRKHTGDGRQESNLLHHPTLIGVTLHQIWRRTTLQLCQIPLRERFKHLDKKRARKQPVQNVEASVSLPPLSGPYTMVIQYYRRLHDVTIFQQADISQLQICLYLVKHRSDVTQIDKEQTWVF